MLGKGLESLIPSSSDSSPAADSKIGSEAFSKNKYQSKKPEDSPGKKAPSGGAVFHIEIEKIKPNPHQPRRAFEEGPLRELASSIGEFGLLQPIVVSKIEKEVPGGTEVEYQLIAGERRWLACKLLGWERIPAVVRNVDLERERLEMAVIENIQRENLNPIERARAFAHLQDEFSLTQREVASRLGKSREVVANLVRLLDLPQSIQEALEKGKISESHGRLLLAINDPAARENLFRELLEYRLTTRGLQNKVRALKNPSQGKGGEGEISSELRMLQETLSSKLSAPVEIRQRGDAGKITISFYSREELESILKRLQNDQEEGLV